MNAATASASARRDYRRPNPKLERTLVTPEGVSLNITVASAGARAGALAMDIGLIIALMIGFTIALALLGWAAVSAGFASGAEGSGILALGEVVLVVWIIGMFLFRNAYFLYFELGDRGATWGKRASGIRVASRDGGRLTPEAVIARNLVRDIELFLPLIFMLSSSGEGGMSSTAVVFGFTWVAIFLLFPLFNKDRLRCGDLIAGTWVIQAPKAKLGAVVAPASNTVSVFNDTASSIYQFTDAELSVYGEYELQTLESVLRGENEDALVAVCEAICRKINWNPGSGEERIFLEAYYTQLRAKLERGMRFGKRRADKFSETQ